MKIPTRVGAFAFALALALGGCGGSTDDGLSAAARAQLTTLVKDVRRAAENGDRQAGQRALSQLRSAVASYESRGDISTARAAQILAAAAGVESRLALIPAPTTTTTTTKAPPDKPGHGDKGDKGDKGTGPGKD
jgi:ribosomal protein S20